jgi:two-component system, cell cycle response regulator
MLKARAQVPKSSSKMASSKRVLLIDPVESSREMLASRLRTLGYDVKTANDGAQGAHEALEHPPNVVIADLAMPSISGAQLCRMLKAESATQQVPVILRGAEGHRNRFWAEQTGASAYVIKGRMGELVRAMLRGFEQTGDEEDGFFVALSSDVSVRDRIAQCLDAALFDSVIAAEVRKLAVCESFDTLFDLLTQFMSQVTPYRWLAVVTDNPARGGVHARSGQMERAAAQVKEALALPEGVRFKCIEDDDPAPDEQGPPALVHPILFGDARLGGLALAPLTSCSSAEDRGLLEIIARELGGPLRTATLVEESRRLATVDALTGLHNRRAFIEHARREVGRSQRHCDPLSMLLLDVDHFKSVNDTHGHAAGDRVLAAVGRMLSETNRRHDVSARWGGEEFVLLLSSTDAEGAAIVAERVRAAVEGLSIKTDAGELVRITASIGASTLLPTETLDALVDRADRAMYAAKTAGRNRVRIADAAPSRAQPEQPDSDKSVRLG